MPNPDGTMTKDETLLAIARNAWSYREAEKALATCAQRGEDYYQVRKRHEKARTALDGALNCLSLIHLAEKHAKDAAAAAAQAASAEQGAA
jgi:hypothetical protein